MPGAQPFFLAPVLRNKLWRASQLCWNSTAYSASSKCIECGDINSSFQTSTLFPPEEHSLKTPGIVRLPVPSTPLNAHINLSLTPGIKMLIGGQVGVNGFIGWQQVYWMLWKNDSWGPSQPDWDFSFFFLHFEIFPVETQIQGNSREESRVKQFTAWEPRPFTAHSGSSDLGEVLLPRPSPCFFCLSLDLVLNIDSLGTYFPVCPQGGWDTRLSQGHSFTWLHWIRRRWGWPGEFTMAKKETWKNTKVPFLPDLMKTPSLGLPVGSSGSGQTFSFPGDVKLDTCPVFLLHQSTDAPDLAMASHCCPG